MKILDLNCNNCGAPLEAPVKAKFITCTFCNVRLKVQSEGPTAWTEDFEKIHGELHALRKEQAVERVDRDWQQERESYFVRGKHGVTHAPSRATGVAAMVIASVFGGFFVMMATTIGASPLAIFGIVFIGIGIFSGINQVKKAERMEAARRKYQRRRRKLIDEIGQGR